MTTYVVLLPGDETAWADATPEQQERTYALHREFAAALAARGHVVSGGAELMPSAQARVLRTGADGSRRVTEGPYAESVEQLTGFYVVESEDLEDLTEICWMLGRTEGAIEIRESVAGPS